MTTEKNITAQAMRQDVLNRLDASRKAILELSDDELESITGGWKGPEKPMHEQKSPSVLRAPEKHYSSMKTSEGGHYAGEGNMSSDANRDRHVPDARPYGKTLVRW